MNGRQMDAVTIKAQAFIIEKLQNPDEYITNKFLIEAHSSKHVLSRAT